MSAITVGPALLVERGRAGAVAMAGEFAWR